MSDAAVGPPSGVRHCARDGAVVSYEAARCRHAAECVRALPDVFDTHRRPWIQPQHASIDALDQVIARCPTQALKLVRDAEARGPVPAG
jgi:uncharacterized Fe-S cluster protein YjdI